MPDNKPTARPRQFILYGPFKPYTRMTRRSKYANKNAIAYNNSQTDLKWQFQQQMQKHGYDPIPSQTPFSVHVVIFMPARLHCQDLDNQAKAVIDAAQGLVFPNDLWMDTLTASRALGSDHLVTVTIIPHTTEELASSDAVITQSTNLPISQFPTIQEAP